jgi:serine/threonine protein kinase
LAFEAFLHPLSWILQRMTSPLAIDEFVGWCEDILSGLVSLEDKSILHRKIQADSAFLVDEGDSGLMLKIGEFGFALEHPSLLELCASDHYDACYLPPYVATTGIYCDCRTDVFCFGVMMADIFVKHVLPSEPLPGSPEQAIRQAIDGAWTKAEAESATAPEVSELYRCVTRLFKNCCVVDTAARWSAKVAYDSV